MEKRPVCGRYKKVVLGFHFLARENAIFFRFPPIPVQILEKNVQNLQLLLRERDLILKELKFDLIKHNKNMEIL